MGGCDAVRLTHLLSLKDELTRLSSSACICSCGLFCCLTHLSYMRSTDPSTNVTHMRLTSFTQTLNASCRSTILEPFAGLQSSFYVLTWTGLLFHSREARFIVIVPLFCFTPLVCHLCPQLSPSFSNYSSSCS